MAPPSRPAAEPRIPLNRERVLRAAVALADDSGIGSLSMRKLGDALGVEAMSLYNHVVSKGDLLGNDVSRTRSRLSRIRSRPNSYSLP